MTRATRTPITLELTGNDLTLTDAEAILRGRVERLALSAAARRRVERARRCVEELFASGATIYGLNTGFGKLAHQRIPPEEVLALQENLLRSHAVGMGALLSIPVSRLALVLRINTLAKGCSGVTAALLDTLAEMYNRGVVPAIPELGSVGASGDLAPLAHLALVVMGEGHAWVRKSEIRSTKSETNSRTKIRSRKRARKGFRASDLEFVSDFGVRPSDFALESGRAALKRAGITPHRPQAKEGLSLINGTQVSTALLADALVLARQLARVADVAGAMTVEATRSSLRPFDERIQAMRPHPGQADCAANLRRLLTDSEIMPSHAHCPKVQDAYSMRCMPQVHGTFRDALAHIERVVAIEMNSATDNPLVFVETGEVISGGNFHGQPVGQAADLLAAAATDLSSISERRTENLVNPDLSGLPGFLTPQPGLNSGLMMVQVLAAALVSENKAHSFPASVDSIPTSANREDHVPMSTAAARKCRAVVINAARVLAAELLCAAQGLDFLQPLRPGRGAEAAYLHIREHVRPLGRDRTLHRDLEAVERLVRSGSLLASVEAAVGALS